jgi:serine protease inhibitor
MKVNKKILYTLFITMAVIGTIAGIKGFQKKRNLKPNPNDVYISVEIPPVNESDFNLRFLKTVNSVARYENYLISPYSVEIALNMLKEGADGNTLKEIEDLVGNREINNITSKKVSVANAIFIRNNFKDFISSNYINTLKNNYDSEVLFDEFKTPKVINDWVKVHTNGMIEKIIDSFDGDVGLANAVAIDVKWMHEFECNKTRSEEWTVGSKKTNVEMMHNTYTYNAKYFKNATEEGVIIPYDNDLEFIGILPKGDLKTYIDNLTKEGIDNIINNSNEVSEDKELVLALPRFSYKYDLKAFIEVLKSMGVKDAFSSNDANFSRMADSILLYVTKAIHKTNIELNEVGTKAAAVTYFELSKNAMPMQKETIEITFNRPFLYIIRNNKNNEMVFVGTVYEPNEWKGSTCDNL